MGIGWQIAFGSLRLMGKAIGGAGKTVQRGAAKRKLSAAQKNAINESANNRAVFCTNTYIHNRTPALPHSTQETLLLTDGSDGQHFQAFTQKASVNMLASGSSLRLRNNALVYFSYDAVANGRSVIVLHCNNQDLQRQLEGGSLGTHCIPVDGRQYKYDPLAKMTSREIASMMFDAIPEKYRAPYSSKTLFQVVAELRQQTGGHLSLKQLAACPIHDLYRIMENLRNKGKLSDSDFSRLESDYASAQHDAGTLRAYLDDLDRQLSDMFLQKDATALEFEKAIQSGSIISINISNQLNELVVSVITEHLRELFRTHRNLALVIDGLSIHPDSTLIKLIRQNQSCNFAISAEDAYAALGARKDDVNALLGGDCRLVLLRHGSPRSCNFWSEYFGEYEKTEMLESFNEGQRGMMGADINRGWSPHKTKERKILSDVFMNFTEGQFCAYDAATGQMILGEI